MEIKQIGKGLAYHLVDTTALNTAANPIMAGLEITAFGMSDEVSINARIFASVIGYLGVGSLLAKGRDLSRRIFGVTEKSKEKVQQFHDGTYLAGFNAVFAPIMYTYSGETDLKKIAIGTLGLMATGAVLGGPIGYAVDSFRDLTGLQNSERNSYPDLVRKQTPIVKKTIATALIAASIGVMSATYSINNFVREYFNQPVAEQRISNTNNQGLEQVVQSKN